MIDIPNISRSHDNSLAGEYELKYTAWMANQDVELSDEEYKKAIKHHFEENEPRGITSSITITVPNSFSRIRKLSSRIK